MANSPTHPAPRGNGERSSLHSDSSDASWIFTSESVTEGHPDKVADFISDSMLDAYLAADKGSRIACEALCKGDVVVLAGEITSRASIDHISVVRDAIQKIGYIYADEPFNTLSVNITQLLTKQALEIATAVSAPGASSQGAGDQGIMFGYATDETPELMPLPIMLAHRLAQFMAEDRKHNTISWLRPDGKTQVSIEYDDNGPKRVTKVLVSTQHAKGTEYLDIEKYVTTNLAPRALGEWNNGQIEFIVNPSGSFEHGGPSADCGLTGRKIIVDTYGGASRHGGGCFSGKDPSKVDRSAAYFCRFVVGKSC